MLEYLQTDVGLFQKSVRKSFHSSGGGVEFFPLVVVGPGEISPTRLIIQSSSALILCTGGKAGAEVLHVDRMACTSKANSLARVSSRNCEEKSLL